MIAEKQIASSPAPSERIISPLWRLVSKRANPIALLNKGDNRLPVYCVHPIAGDVTSLQSLAGLLGPEHDFYGIQVPKDRMNADFAGSIETIAGHYVASLNAFQPEGALVLGGWSAGAIIALEMAQQLRKLGRDVPLLVALDGAPCNTGAGLSTWHPLYLYRLACNLPRWIKDDLKHQDWSLRGIKRRVEAKLAIRHKKTASKLRTAQTLDAGAVESLLDSRGWLNGQRDFIHSLYEAMLAYKPEPYPGRVIVYETDTQPLYHLRQVAASWTKIAQLTEVVPLRSNHSGMLQAPTVGTIADHLRMRLATDRLAVLAAEQAAVLLAASKQA